jgi:hypothetical protein
LKATFARKWRDNGRRCTGRSCTLWAVGPAEANSVDAREILKNWAEHVEYIIDLSRRRWLIVIVHLVYRLNFEILLLCLDSEHAKFRFILDFAVLFFIFIILEQLHVFPILVRSHIYIRRQSVWRVVVRITTIQQCQFSGLRAEDEIMVAAWFSVLLLKGWKMYGKDLIDSDRSTWTIVMNVIKNFLYPECSLRTMPADGLAHVVIQWRPEDHASCSQLQKYASVESRGNQTTSVTSFHEIE